MTIVLRREPLTNDHTQSVSPLSVHTRHYTCRSLCMHLLAGPRTRDHGRPCTPHIIMTLTYCCMDAHVSPPPIHMHSLSLIITPSPYPLVTRHTHEDAVLSTLDLPCPGPGQYFPLVFLMRAALFSAPRQLPHLGAHLLTRIRLSFPPPPNARRIILGL